MKYEKIFKFNVVIVILMVQLKIVIMLCLLFCTNYIYKKKTEK